MAHFKTHNWESINSDPATFTPAPVAISFSQFLADPHNSVGGLRIADGDGDGDGDGCGRQLRTANCELRCPNQGPVRDICRQSRLPAACHNDTRRN